MGKKVFQKPFVEKIEFDAKEVIATSSNCSQLILNSDNNWIGECTGGNKQYLALTPTSRPV